MVKEKKKLGLAEELAAMMFYAEFKDVQVGQFEDLAEPDQKIWIARSRNALKGLDQLEKMVVVKQSPEDSWEKRCKNVDILTAIIQSFVKDLKNTKADLFPCRELAIRILDGKL